MTRHTRRRRKGGGEWFSNCRKKCIEDDRTSANDDSYTGTYDVVRCLDDCSEGNPNESKGNPNESKGNPNESINDLQSIELALKKCSYPEQKIKHFMDEYLFKIDGNQYTFRNNLSNSIVTTINNLRTRYETSKSIFNIFGYKNMGKLHRRINSFLTYDVMNIITQHRQPKENYADGIIEEIKGGTRRRRPRKRRTTRVRRY